jgi:hypothetical protein
MQSVFIPVHRKRCVIEKAVRGEKIRIKGKRLGRTVKNSKEGQVSITFGSVNVVRL